MSGMAVGVVVLPAAVAGGALLVAGGCVYLAGAGMYRGTVTIYEELERRREAEERRLAEIKLEYERNERARMAELKGAEERITPLFHPPTSEREIATANLQLELIHIKRRAIAEVSGEEAQRLSAKAEQLLVKTQGETINLATISIELDAIKHEFKEAKEKPKPIQPGAHRETRIDKVRKRIELLKQHLNESETKALLVSSTNWNGLFESLQHCEAIVEKEPEICTQKLELLEEQVKEGIKKAIKEQRQRAEKMTKFDKDLTEARARLSMIQEYLPGTVLAEKATQVLNDIRSRIEEARYPRVPDIGAYARVTEQLFKEFEIEARRKAECEYIAGQLKEILEKLNYEAEIIPSVSLLGEYAAFAVPIQKDLGIRTSVSVSAGEPCVHLDMAYMQSHPGDQAGMSTEQFRLDEEKVCRLSEKIVKEVRNRGLDIKNFNQKKIDNPEKAKKVKFLRKMKDKAREKVAKGRRRLASRRDETRPVKYRNIGE